MLPNVFRFLVKLCRANGSFSCYESLNTAIAKAVFVKDTSLDRGLFTHPSGHHLWTYGPWVDQRARVLSQSGFGLLFLFLYSFGSFGWPLRKSKSHHLGLARQKTAVHSLSALFFCSFSPFGSRGIRWQGITKTASLSARKRRQYKNVKNAPSLCDGVKHADRKQKYPSVSRSSNEHTDRDH